MLRVHNHNDLHGRCILRESLIRGDVDEKLTTANAEISVAPNESLKLYMSWVFIVLYYSKIRSDPGFSCIPLSY